MGYKEAGSLISVFVLAVMVAIFTNYLASQIRIVGGIEGFMSGTETSGENVSRKDVRSIKAFLKYLSFDTVNNELRITAPGGLFVDNKVQIKESANIPLSNTTKTFIYNLGPWGKHSK